MKPEIKKLVDTKPTLIETDEKTFCWCNANCECEDVYDPDCDPHCDHGGGGGYGSGIVS